MSSTSTPDPEQLATLALEQHAHHTGHATDARERSNFVDLLAVLMHQAGEDWAEYETEARAQYELERELDDFTNPTDGEPCTCSTCGEEYQRGKGKDDHGAEVCGPCFELQPEA